MREMLSGIRDTGFRIHFDTLRYSVQAFCARSDSYFGLLVSGLDSAPPYALAGILYLPAS